MPNETICLIPNIGPRGIRRRRIMGSVCLALGLTLATWMMAAHASSVSLALLVLPFTLGTLYLLQAHERT